MKNILFVFILMISSIAFAQNWETNWEKASATASEKNENIVLVFSGSDWCGPCIKLDREIWQSGEFQELSKDHFVMLRADFPRKSKNALTAEQQEHNSKLAEKYNTYGYFPYVVVLDPTGKVLGSMGYEKTTPELYFNKLKALEN